MKYRKLWILSFITALFMILGVGNNVQEVKAAGAGTIEQAKAAYYTLLSKQKISWGSSKIYTSDLQYTIEDINGDKLPELILRYYAASHAEGYQRIYTYIDGKVKSLGHLTDIIEISKNKNYFVDGYANCGMSEVEYYRLKDGKKKKLVSFKTSDTYPSDVKRSEVKKITSNGSVYYYYACKVNGKKTTYKKCMNKIKELQKNAKYLELYYSDNVYPDYAIEFKDKEFTHNGCKFYTGYKTYVYYPSVYKEKKNGTLQILQEMAVILGRRDKYIYTTKYSEIMDLNSLFVINANTGKIRRISSTTDGCLATTKKYVYYPSYLKYKENDVAFKIYRCNLQGKNKKVMTKKIIAKYIVKCTSTYVQYQKGSAQYKYYYSSGKVKKVS